LSSLLPGKGEGGYGERSLAVFGKKKGSIVPSLTKWGERGEEGEREFFLRIGEEKREEEESKLNCNPLRRRIGREGEVRSTAVLWHYFEV